MCKYREYIKIAKATKNCISRAISGHSMVDTVDMDLVWGGRGEGGRGFFL